MPPEPTDRPRPTSWVFAGLAGAVAVAVIASIALAGWILISRG